MEVSDFVLTLFDATLTMIERRDFRLVYFRITPSLQKSCDPTPGHTLGEAHLFGFIALSSDTGAKGRTQIV